MLVSHVLPKKLPNSEHFPHWRQLWCAVCSVQCSVCSVQCVCSVYQVATCRFESVVDELYPEWLACTLVLLNSLMMSSYTCQG